MVGFDYVDLDGFCEWFVVVAGLGGFCGFGLVVGVV